MASTYHSSLSKSLVIVLGPLISLCPGVSAEDTEFDGWQLYKNAGILISALKDAGSVTDAPVTPDACLLACEQNGCNLMNLSGEAGSEGYVRCDYYVVNSLVAKDVTIADSENEIFYVKSGTGFPSDLRNNDGSEDLEESGDESVKVEEAGTENSARCFNFGAFSGFVSLLSLVLV